LSRADDLDEPHDAGRGALRRPRPDGRDVLQRMSRVRADERDRRCARGRDCARDRNRPFRPATRGPRLTLARGLVAARSLQREAAPRARRLRPPSEATAGPRTPPGTDRRPRRGKLQLATCSPLGSESARIRHGPETESKREWRHGPVRSAYRRPGRAVRPAVRAPDIRDRRRRPRDRRLLRGDRSPAAVVRADPPAVARDPLPARASSGRSPASGGGRPTGPAAERPPPPARRSATSAAAAASPGLVTRCNLPALALCRLPRRGCRCGRGRSKAAASF
jgi:hypothetical protein